LPIYPYKCPGCGLKLEFVRSIKNSDPVEPCPECGEELVYIFTPPQVIGAAVQNAEYNPGLGCVTRNSQHRKEIAKHRGLIETGSETPDVLHRESVVKREKEREKEWDNVA
jgi:putative FmdB family regulatory protein